MGSQQHWALRENMLGTVVPPAVREWPPIRRMLLVRAGSRVLGLRHLVLACVEHRFGDGGRWALFVAALIEQGFLLPHDPPLPILADWQFPAMLKRDVSRKNIPVFRAEPDLSTATHSQLAEGEQEKPWYEAENTE